ncbi:LuxR C-terminal-related transcriptional regulator [Leifsonia poae]|uniref:LuxR C-terminal-related transcriptional regulator n=1 Tax=Leifsonia poae TaxID=110933 RepID=UPI001CBE19F6|nr:LuxR C-terminal-related transcriptional regulator [Leifsonia poae]
MSDTTLVGVPRLPSRFLHRPRVTDRLDEHDGVALVVVRAPGGSGKTLALADWLRRRPGDETQVWVALDDRAASRGGFWFLVVRALADAGLVGDEGPLRDFLAGYLDVTFVPAWVADALNGSGRHIRLVLDDLHTAPDESIDDLVRILPRIQGAQLIVATRRRSRLESIVVRERIDTATILATDLAFDTAEVHQLGRQNGNDAFSGDTAEAIRAATVGHTLATRLAIAATATPAGAPHDLGRIAADAVRDMIPSLDDDGRRFALRIALAPAVDRFLASRLTGVADAGPMLARFEREGLGEFDEHGMFSFHVLVRLALEREAERDLDGGEVRSLRRVAASDFADRRGWALTAVELSVRAGDTARIWPIVAQNFSDLINHHDAELERVVSLLSPEQIAADGTVGIVLAIVQSEHEAMPSFTLVERVDTALAELAARRPPVDAVEAFYRRLSEFAGLRSARRYTQAVLAGTQVVGILDAMTPDDRRRIGPAAGAGMIQIVITNVLEGRMRQAAVLAERLAADTHPGRRLHRRALVGYIHALRGEMVQAGTMTDQMAESRIAQWRATVPATGWYIAESLMRIERNDVTGALETIAEIDARIARVEHWPYLLWVRAYIRLVAGEAEVGLDELAHALAVNGARAASDTALAQLVGIRSDLNIAAGRLETARSLLETCSDSRSAHLAIARARLALATGDAGAALLVESLAKFDDATPRQRLDALLLVSVARARSGHRTESVAALKRAIAIADLQGLRSPFALVPRAELAALIAEEFPSSGELLDGRADPFGRALAAVSLTDRELVVLRRLATDATLRQIADELFVSLNTVKTQVASVYRKLDVASRDQAAAEARRRHLVD